MNTIEKFGWNEILQKTYNPFIRPEFEIGRVISIKGFKNILITNSGESEAELSGKLLYGNDTESLPKVGDWVMFIRYDAIGYIVDVLPRTNDLHRKHPGTKTEKQVLAANINGALVVQGLDQNFNIMRLERYLVQVTACDIPSIVILNKSDLTNDTAYYQKEVEKLNRDAQVYFCSTYNNTGISELINHVLEDGKTYILIGSSGVGKSSLLNALMGKAERDTGHTSASTGKGRHITTSRDLFRLPNGSLVIDTPGMREFGMAFNEEDFNGNLFPAIESLSKNCRFSDCRHLEEEGCAVIEAFNSGSLEAEVYHSYLKLVKEQKHFEETLADKKRLGKQFGKMVREANTYRKKYKF